MIRTLALISSVVLSLSFSSVFADFYVTHKISTDSYKKDKKEGETQVRTSTQWFAGDKLRSDENDTSVIMLLDKDTIYSINHKKKTFFALKASTFGMPADAQSDGEQVPAAMISSMMGSMFKMEVTIEPTNEKKKIGQWNCIKYNQTVKMMGVTIATELWATEDVTIDKKLLDKFMASQFMTQPGMQDLAAKMLKEAEKIKGCVVYSKSVTTMGNKRTETIDEVTEIKEQTAPQDTWVVPAKYKMKKPE